MKELINTLVSTYGEFSEYEGKIEWYAEIDSFDPESEEPHDRLWDIYCQTVEEIEPKLGNNFKIVDNWADNDSCGFTIEKI